MNEFEQCDVGECLMMLMAGEVDVVIGSYAALLEARARVIAQDQRATAGPEWDAQAATQEATFTTPATNKKEMIDNSKVLSDDSMHPVLEKNKLGQLKAEHFEKHPGSTLYITGGEISSNLMYSYYLAYVKSHFADSKFPALFDAGIEETLSENQVSIEAINLPSTMRGHHIKQNTVIDMSWFLLPTLAVVGLYIVMQVCYCSLVCCRAKTAKKAKKAKKAKSRSKAHRQASFWKKGQNNPGKGVNRDGSPASSGEMHGDTHGDGGDGGLSELSEDGDINTCSTSGGEFKAADIDETRHINNPMGGTSAGLAGKKARSRGAEDARLKAEKEAWETAEAEMKAQGSSPGGAVQIVASGNEVRKEVEMSFV